MFRTKIVDKYETCLGQKVVDKYETHSTGLAVCEIIKYK